MTQHTRLDLDTYLARIGYSGPGLANAQTLRDLHRLHPAAITFENLDTLLNRPVALDLDSVTRKLVAEGRGGYCYEHNTLFMAALQALGFSVRSLAGRVQLNLGNQVAARHHMVLLVETEHEQYIADVGFGGLTLTAPLRFLCDLEQETPHGRYRIVSAGGEYQVQALIEQTWRALYQFCLAEQADADWEAANWYISTHPGSIFVTNLIAARPVGGDRFALRNNRLRVHRSDGGTENRTFSTPTQLFDCLAEDFRLKLPGTDELALIARTAGLA